MKYRNMKHKAFMTMVDLIRCKIEAKDFPTILGHDFPGFRTVSACRNALPKIKLSTVSYSGLSEVRQRDVEFLLRLRIYSIEDATRHLAQYIRHPVRGITPPKEQEADWKSLNRIASAFGIPVIRIGGKIQFHWGYTNDALLDEQAKMVERCASRVAATDLFRPRIGGKARGPLQLDPQLEETRGTKKPRAGRALRDKRRSRGKTKAQEAGNQNRTLIGFLDDEPVFVEAKARVA